MIHNPTILFVCPHNANRSQMAAAYLRHLAEGRVTVLSAGPTPADRLNPTAVEAMADDGINIADVQPQLLTSEVIEDADVIITLGCAAAAPAQPGKRFENWILADPAGRDLAAMRPMREEIKQRVQRLLDDLV